MKFGQGKEFDNFMEILEKHFLDSGDLSEKKIKSFQIELKELALANSDLAKNLIHYFDKIFSTAELKTTDKPLHTNRDFALELFAKVFSVEVSGATGTEVKMTNFLMFLAGIIDSPYTLSPDAEKIGLFAGSDEPVLINGETGTGKELHAKVIHYRSARLNEPFKAVNCAGIPDTLLESELFGYEKGAFTGATKETKGFLEVVGNGTLFFDEIGDMSLAAQAKLLRVLQSGEYYRVGGKVNMHFKGRVIAATNKDLKAEIKEESPKFRPDLYYRLNVLSIKLPPLEDLPVEQKKLAILHKLRHIIYLKTKEPGHWGHLDFLGDGSSPVYCDDEGNPVVPDNPHISEDALHLLVNYDFPGNYRELDNIMRRAYILSKGERIEVSALPDEVKVPKDESTPAELSDVDVDSICMKDIVDFAEKIKKDIVRRKYKSAQSKGQNLKAVLRNEGVTEGKDYQRIRKRIVGVIGQEAASRIRKPK